MLRVEQVLGVLNTDEKDLLCEYHDRLFKCLESVQRTTDAELCVLLIKENGISRDFSSDICIPPSTSTMGEFVTLRYVSTFLGNCCLDKIM